MIEIPVPEVVPLQEELYQFQIAPVPDVPPVSVNVTVLPVQIVPEDGVIAEGFVLKLFISMFTLKHEVVLHSPSALAQ